MISEPETYRPGGGETTFELRDRVVAWRSSVVEQNKLVVAVTHGGPIAALVGTEKELPVSDWVKLIPGCGQWVRLSNENCEQA
jgi:broad specificity phosphatase PhoE